LGSLSLQRNKNIWGLCWMALFYILLANWNLHTWWVGENNFQYHLDVSPWTSIIWFNCLLCWFCVNIYCIFLYNDLWNRELSFLTKSDVNDGNLLRNGVQEISTALFQWHRQYSKQQNFNLKIFNLNASLDDIVYHNILSMQLCYFCVRKLDALKPSSNLNFVLSLKENQRHVWAP